MNCWILIIVGYLAITGYKSETDCQAAAAKFKVVYITHCIPASQDAVVSVAQ